jgi:hypothetical protein
VLGLGPGGKLGLGRAQRWLRRLGLSHARAPVLPEVEAEPRRLPARDVRVVPVARLADRVDVAVLLGLVGARDLDAHGGHDRRQPLERVGHALRASGPVDRAGLVHVLAQLVVERAGLARPGLPPPCHEVHDLLRHRRRLDGVQRRLLAVLAVPAHERARPHAYRALDGHAPPGEPRHSGQRLQIHARQQVERLAGQVEQRPEQPALRLVECAQHLALLPAPSLELWQLYHHGAVEQVGLGRDADDAVEQDEPPRAERHLLQVGVELAGGEAALGRQPAQRVGEPAPDGRQVVVLDEPRVVGRDHQRLEVPRLRPLDGRVRVDEAAGHQRDEALAGALAAVEHEYNVRAERQHALGHPSNHNQKVGVRRDVDELPQVFDPAAALRHGQWQRAATAPEKHWGLGHYIPAARAQPDGVSVMRPTPRVRGHPSRPGSA